jgi:predicted ArsR family transcriptional regulator
MTSNRERILELLETNRAMTSGELSRTLQVTPADIRHHLRRLVRDRLIMSVGERKALGKGRPSKVYMLAGQGENVTRLAGKLLQEWLQSHPQPDSETYTQLAHLIYAPAPAPAGHITQRLLYAIQQVNKHHYLAHWEAHADAPQVVFGHCPFLSILDDHPELCQMDEAYLGELLGTRVEQLAKREPNRMGLPICRFRVE